MRKICTKSSAVRRGRTVAATVTSSARADPLVTDGGSACEDLPLIPRGTAPPGAARLDANDSPRHRQSSYRKRSRYAQEGRMLHRRQLFDERQMNPRLPRRVGLLAGGR